MNLWIYFVERMEQKGNPKQLMEYIPLDPLDA
jgi:hypothetical protein